MFGIRYLFAVIFLASTNLSFAGPLATEAGLNWDLTPSRPGLAIQLPGMSHHFQKPQESGREWNQTHYGIGLEMRSSYSETVVLKKSFGLMKDSLNMWGAYGGVTLQKRLYESSAWRADLGGGAFLFYRALHFNGKRNILPGLLPVASLEHQETGLGINILYVPHVKMNNGEMPAVLYAQMTKRF